MKRRKIIAGNWKMNLSPTEAADYFRKFHELQSSTQTIKNTSDSWVIFPVAYCLTGELQTLAGECGFELGAQNVHWENKGAFTGELSASTLKSMNIHWCLLGHSERRQHFGENEEHLGKRFLRALETGMNIIYCIGETLAERESGKMEDVLRKQLQPFAHVMKTLGAGQSTVSLAYEPVWAIGTGKTATPIQAEAAHKFIRRELELMISVDVASKLSILYGGSVTPENASTLMAVDDIDGVLVGGASLKPDQFHVIAGA